MEIGKNRNTADVHFFFQNQPLLDDENFLDNRYDRDVLLLMNRGNGVDLAGLWQHA